MAAACAVLPLYALLANATTQLGMTVNLTATLSSGPYPAIYPGQAANASVTVALPDVIFNTTVISGGAYRLEVSARSADALWGASGAAGVRLSPGALFQQLTSSASVSADGIASYVVDFVVVNSSSAALRNQLKSAFLGLTLTYPDYASHSGASVNATAVLTPWSWLSWDLTDGNDWEQSLFNATVNVTASYRNLGPIAANLTTPYDCSLVDGGFIRLTNWANVSQCTRCVYLQSLSSVNASSSVTIVNLDPQPCGIVPNYTSFASLSVDGAAVAVSTPLSPRVVVTAANQSTTPQLDVGRRANITYSVSLPTQLLSDRRLRSLTYYMKMTVTLDPTMSLPTQGVRLRTGALVSVLRPLATQTSGGQIQSEFTFSINQQATIGGGGGVEFDLDTAFSASADPGSYAYAATFDLVPWNWVYWSLNDSYNWELNVSQTHGNLSQYASWGALPGGSEASFPNGCAFVTSNFSATLASWSQVAACQHCAYYEASAVRSSPPARSTLQLLGPVLAVSTYTTPPSPMEAGQQFDWFVSISHVTPASTREAADVQILIVLNSYWIVNASSLLAQCVGNATCPVSTEYTSGVINVTLQSTLAVNESLVIRATARFPDDMQMVLGNFDRGSAVSVSYVDVTQDGTRVARSKEGFIIADVKGLHVTESADLNSSPWTHSQPRSTRFALSVPFGKATNFFLKLRVQPLLDVGPALRNFSFTITAMQPTLLITGPATLPAIPISTTSSALSDGMDFYFPRYNITNSPRNGTSGSIMNITLSYYLNANVTKDTVLLLTAYLNTDGVPPLNFSSDATVAGPVLVLNPVFTPSSGIQAGDIVQWRVSIQHQPVVSNEDATDAKIAIVLDKFLTITTTPVTVSGILNGSSYNLSYANNSPTITLTVAYFPLSNGMIIVNGSALVSRAIPVTTTGTVCSLNATASYRSVPEATAVSTLGIGQVSAMTSNILYQFFQTAWTPGLQATLGTTLSLPRGTVGNAAVTFEVFDGSGAQLQVRSQSTLTSNSTGLAFTPLPTADLSNGSYSKIVFAVSNLTNPPDSTSPATLSFSIIYLLADSAHQGHTIQSKITWTLQSESAPLSSSSSTTVAMPALAISCFVSPAAGVQAGDIIGWNVSVWHTPSSTTWANDVQVVVVMDRYWTARVGTVQASGIANGRSFSVSTYNSSSIVTSFGQFGLTDLPITLSGRAMVGDDMPVLSGGYSAVLAATVIYKGVGIQTDPFESSATATSTGKPISITSSGARALSPLQSWAIGQPATITVQLNIPRGTMYAYFQYVIATVNDDSVPVKVLAPAASGPGVISSILNGTSPFAVSGNRKKRALTATVTSPAVKVVVPGTTNVSSISITINNTVFPSATATPQAIINITAALVVSGNSISLGNTVTTILAPSLQLIKKSELQAASDGSVQTVRYTISITHDSTSSYGAGSISVNDYARGMVLLDSYAVVPNTSVLSFPADNTLLWTIDSLPLGKTATILFFAQPAGLKGRSLPAGSTTQEADLTYSTNVVNPAEKPSYTAQSKTCVTRTDIPTKSYLSDHGYTFLLAVMGVIGGVGIVVSLTIIIILCMKKYCPHAYESSVEPLEIPRLDLRNFKNRTKDALDSIGRSLKKGFNSLQDITQMALEDSIVKILALRDKLLIGRELDCLDIKAAARADQKLEKARLDALQSALDALLHGMVHNGDVKQKVFSDGRTKLKSVLEQGSKALDSEYEKILFSAQKTIAVKNKRAVEEIMKKHKLRKDQVIERSQDSKSKEVKSILSTIDDECHAELEELSSVSRLQLEEQAEKLRKELTLRKRIQLKEYQQHFINFVVTESKLVSEQAQWLMQTHKENQAAIEKQYDDRLLQMKLLLEEKLAKRRILAEANQADSEGHSELLNQVAGGQIDILKRAKKIGVLTPEELKGMTQEAMDRMAATKEAWERERARQETELHQKLCQHKRKLIEAKEKENQVQFDALSQQQRQRLKAEAIDPLSLETEKLELLAEQDAIVMELESKIDAENAEELRLLQSQLVEKAKDELLKQEKHIGDTLKKEGMDSEQIDTILSDHDKSVQRLKELQQSQREKLEADLQAKLQQRRREWQKSMEEEQAEQATLREQEDQVMQELVAKQVAMSDEDREKIIKEHEKNMARLENNLTFSRLQQRRILEEKLAQRRAAKIDKLEQEQLIEQKKSQGKRKNETEDERLAAEMTLLKKQADERLEASRMSDDISLEDEMEKVKLEMMAERAKQLREQEDHIGSLLVSLQLSKAKELAEIDEKQKAITALTTNLMEDLTDRGILSDPECQKVISKHQMDQEKLIRKLDEERDKQERMLKSKLALKLQQREKSVIASQEEKLRAVMKGTKNATAGLLRRAAVMARNKAEIEDFRIRMEKEISQTLEDLRRQQMTKKRRLVQELEMRFVAGLIKLGKLKRSELLECLRLLFPSKTEVELDQLITNLHDGSSVADDQQAYSSEEDLLTSSSASMLKDRIQRAVIASHSSLQTVREEESETAEDGKERVAPRKKKSVKNKPTPIPDESDEEMLVPVGQRGSDGAAFPNSDNGKDDAPQPKSQRKKSASPLRRESEPKEAPGDLRPSKALPPLKAVQPRRAGPNSSMDHVT